MRRAAGGRTGPVVVRACWAAALVLAPERMLAAAPGRPVPPGLITVARVLGARHLLQSAATARAGRGRVATLGAVVDGLHIASCLVIAAVSPRLRGVALTDAAIEAAVALADHGTRARP